jgi:hypothetical protein
MQVAFLSLWDVKHGLNDSDSYTWTKGKVSANGLAHSPSVGCHVITYLGADVLDVIAGDLQSLSPYSMFCKLNNKDSTRNEGPDDVD